jgi:hypothetical protein
VSEHRAVVEALQGEAPEGQRHAVADELDALAHVAPAKALGARGPTEAHDLPANEGRVADQLDGARQLDPRPVDVERGLPARSPWDVLPPWAGSA